MAADILKVLLQQFVIPYHHFSGIFAAISIGVIAESDNTIPVFAGYL